MHSHFRRTTTCAPSYSNRSTRFPSNVSLVVPAAQRKQTKVSANARVISQRRTHEQFRTQECGNRAGGRKRHVRDERRQVDRVGRNAHQVSVGGGVVVVDARNMVVVVVLAAMRRAVVRIGSSRAVGVERRRVSSTMLMVMLCVARVFARRHDRVGRSRRRCCWQVRACGGRGARVHREKKPQNEECKKKKSTAADWWDDSYFVAGREWSAAVRVEVSDASKRTNSRAESGQATSRARSTYTRALRTLD